MSSFIAVMEQMGGKSICQLWHHPTCAQAWGTSAVMVVDRYDTSLKGRELFCLHLIFKLEMFSWRWCFLSSHSNSISCHISMQLILDTIWFLNGWSVNAIIMFGMLGKWCETFMFFLHMLPKLWSKSLLGPSVC